jgi:amino acid transporter
MEKRFLAGIILFAGFIVSVATIIVLFMDYLDYESTDPDYAQSQLTYAGIQAIVGIVILIGAMAAISGKSFNISVLGAIVCLLFGGVMMLGSVCGLIALVLLILAKSEFQDLYFVQPGSDQYYEEGYGGSYEGGPQYAVEQTDQYGRPQTGYYDEQQPRYP